MRRSYIMLTGVVAAISLSSFLAIAAEDPARALHQQNLFYASAYGEGIAAALVVAFNKAEPLTKLKARTDKDGRVTFKLPRAGVWLVTSVHQIPTPWYARADWESFWASLTFELPPRRR